MELVHCSHSDCHYQKSSQRHYHGNHMIVPLNPDESYCGKCKEKYGTINDSGEMKFKHCENCCKTYVEQQSMRVEQNGQICKISYHYDHHCECKNEYMLTKDLLYCNCFNFLPLLGSLMSCLVDTGPGSGKCDIQRFCMLTSCCGMTRVFQNDSFVTCGMFSCIPYCCFCPHYGDTFTRFHYRDRYGLREIDKASKHCNVCCKIYSRDEIHCEKCHNSHKQNLNHCVTCCQTYSSSLKHCHKCHKSYTDKEVHCDKCCVIYNPQTTYHCESCHSYHVQFPSCIICKNEPPDQTELSQICTICIENINDNMYATECGHIFHAKCISAWTKRNQSCPLCRTQLRQH